MQNGPADDLPLPSIQEVINHYIEWRKSQGQPHTSKQIAAFGTITARTIEAIRQYENNPSKETMVTVCKALRIPPFFLFMELWGTDEWELPPTDIPDRRPFPRNLRLKASADDVMPPADPFDDSL